MKNLFKSSVCLILCFLVFLHAAPLTTRQTTQAISIDKRTKALNYLHKYGYVANSSIPVLSKNSNSPSSVSDDLVQGIKEFQRSIGLKPTGELDSVTEKLMDHPRCGVKERLNSSTRRKRGDSEIKWRTSYLKYRFLSYTMNLPTQTTKDVIAQAFKYWTDVTPLSITEAAAGENADINILFAAYDHGDGFPFDGPGNTLAHTFYPLNGGTHFDESEYWSDNSYDGYNLLSVATHEIGHALGLGHSPLIGDIMYALYTPYRPDFHISSNDVLRIQQFYGTNNNAGLPETPRATRQTTPFVSTSTSTTTTTTQAPLLLGTPPPTPYRNDDRQTPVSYSASFVNLFSTSKFFGATALPPPTVRPYTPNVNSPPPMVRQTPRRGK